MAWRGPLAFQRPTQVRGSGLKPQVLRVDKSPREGPATTGRQTEGAQAQEAPGEGGKDQEVNRIPCPAHRGRLRTLGRG